MDLEDYVVPLLLVNFTSIHTDCQLNLSELAEGKGGRGGEGDNMVRQQPVTALFTWGKTAGPCTVSTLSTGEIQPGERGGGTSSPANQWGELEWNHSHGPGRWVTI